MVWKTIDHPFGHPYARGYIPHDAAVTAKRTNTMMCAYCGRFYAWPDFDVWPNHLYARCYLCGGRCAPVVSFWRRWLAAVKARLTR